MKLSEVKVDQMATIRIWRHYSCKRRCKHVSDYYEDRGYGLQYV